MTIEGGIWILSFIRQNSKFLSILWKRLNFRLLRVKFRRFFPQDTWPGYNHDHHVVRSISMYMWTVKCWQHIVPSFSFCFRWFFIWYILDDRSFWFYDFFFSFYRLVFKHLLTQYGFSSVHIQTKKKEEGTNLDGSCVGSYF